MNCEGSSSRSEPESESKLPSAIGRSQPSKVRAPPSRRGPVRIDSQAAWRAPRSTLSKELPPAGFTDTKRTPSSYQASFKSGPDWRKLLPTHGSPPATADSKDRSCCGVQQEIRPAGATFLEVS